MLSITRWASSAAATLVLVLTMFSGAAQAQEHWGAIAVALTKTQVTMHVVRNYKSQDAAEAKALTDCRKSGLPGCKIVGTFNNGGCGWGATGKNDSTGRVGWGTGPTEAAALKNCAGEGLICTKVVGGCTNRPG